MANAEYEAVDLNKKRLIEEILVEERDDAIIRVAKMRKRQPRKLRSKARNIAENMMHYYYKVSIKVDPETDLYNAEHDFSEFVQTTGSHNLSILSKAITECLAEREQIMKVRRSVSQVGGFSQNRNQGKPRFPFLASPHISSTDFIVDENLQW